MQNGSPTKVAMKWLQPGVLTGVAMRIVCFVVLQGNTGIVAPPVQDTGSNVLRMWDRIENGAIHIGSQAVQAYENIRFVYHVAQRLREMEREPTDAGLRSKAVRFRECSGRKKLALAEHERNMETVRSANAVAQNL